MHYTTTNVVWLAEGHQLLGHFVSKPNQSLAPGPRPVTNPFQIIGSVPEIRLLNIILSIFSANSYQNFSKDADA